MSAVEMIEDLGTAAPVVGERSAEEAGCVALARHSDGNVEVVAGPGVGGVVEQSLAVLSVPGAHLPLEVSSGVVVEHLTEVQTAVLQAVLEVASLCTPGLVLVRAVTAVVTEIADLKTTVKWPGYT